jgi:hypothetical protein
MDVSTKLQRTAKLAREDPKRALTTLAHHIDVEFLREAYRRTRQDGATGVDGQTAEEYGRNLEANLHSLLDRFKSGTYRAPPVRRVQIPKGDGKKTRPIGIPTFEDKVLQRGVSMVVEAIDEQDFHFFSFGFRPRRGPHDALQYLWNELMAMGGGWVVKRQTASSRFRRALRRIDDWCRRHRHLPVREQHRELSRKLRGHYGYYGITGNSYAIGRFAWWVNRTWRRWLNCAGRSVPRCRGPGSTGCAAVTRCRRRAASTPASRPRSESVARRTGRGNSARPDP